ncbi:MAG: alpha/beta hydrolase [Verrucomicrobiales bacterium]|nr:alpha/beta hydrolase [Verrucomicrobiales bacterium]
MENPKLAAADEDQHVIVYVHGFDNTVGSWLVRSDTVFKRLYWAGYSGKFASVRWPCKLLPPKSLDPFSYNLSELYAFKSAYGFKDYLNQLRCRFPSYRLHILAHSQGAAVVSEALRLGAPFDTVILAQAAMPASCYDVNASSDADLVARDAGPFITPEWQPMGYRGVYTNIAGRLLNFFNPADGILRGAWMWDQKFNKPDGAAYALNYFYDGTNGWRVLDVGLIRLVTDPQESRAMISRSRTWAIGVQGPVSGQAQGVIGSGVDLQASFGFGYSRAEHSALFTRPVQTVRQYYRQVLIEIQPSQ